uniref:Cytochrome c oxidase subunit 3 n=1 Tax=Tetrancistrum nebulosi TaxID=879209 RepID=I3NLR5_9PLAT|nr:cytochrome c oxidase subunit III [Tetrancistrum nebulosi]ADN44058.1 cytochrome c oxidase subunit III [Tetrancistrum nebulosi]
MTWLPIFNAFVALSFLASSFLWSMEGLKLFLALTTLASLYLWAETESGVKLHFVDSFWLFILSEVMAFGSLLTSCLWFQEGKMINLSEYDEIPLLGCFLLIGSSITVTAYHHVLHLAKGTYHLVGTIILGIGFVMLQMVEFSECDSGLISSVYHASCFCTVGLHFSHVVIGLSLLIVLLIKGAEVIGEYYTTLFVWYWHFVDYVWLFVYTIVYLC